TRPVKVRPVPYFPEPTPARSPMMTDVNEGSEKSNSDEESEEDDEEVEDNEIPEREGDALA
ncbi:MAG: hypothetical protein AAB855_04455, partial [Patescibacteria group bacterium]